MEKLLKKVKLCLKKIEYRVFGEKNYLFTTEVLTIGTFREFRNREILIIDSIRIEDYFQYTFKTLNRPYRY